MKNITTEQIENLISNYNKSAYVQQRDITELAEELIEDEELEEVESSILEDVNSYLEDYTYIEREHNGRHIWHKDI